MNVDVVDAGVIGGLEVDLVLIALTTELKIELCTPSECGEAGKVVSERAGVTRSSARAISGERGSVAHSSTLDRRPPLRPPRRASFATVSPSYGDEIVFFGSELMVCVFGDVGKGVDRKSRYLGPSGKGVCPKYILYLRSTKCTFRRRTAHFRRRSKGVWAVSGEGKDEAIR